MSTPSTNVDLYSTPLGIGQYLTTYTSVPNYTKAPLDVTLSHAAVATTSTPSLVTIPNGSNYVYFKVTGTGTGTDTITATAAGHNPGFGTVIVGQGRIDASAGWRTSMAVGDSTLVTLYTRAPDGGSTRPLVSATTFSIASNPSVTFTLGGVSGTPITSVVVPADAYYVQFYMKAAASGTASITISNADYVSYTNSVAVSP